MRSFSLKIANPLSVKFLLMVILLELFLGGGGRLIDVGSLSPRMYLFLFSLILSAVFISRGAPVNRNFVFLLLAGTLSIVTSIIIGFINGAGMDMIANDVKPLLSFYLLLFLYFVIQTKNDVLLVVRLLKFSAVVLAILYILVFILINIKAWPFMSFYRLVGHTEEFFFRGNYAFFYKGFIYVCIGLFFFLAEDNIRKRIILLLIVATILTFTRGFLVAIMVSYIFYLIFIKRSPLKLILISALLTVATFVLWGVIYTKIDRSFSDSARILQIQEVLQEVTPISAIVGHGFGIGVPSRPERMEIAYLEIFHKQGIIGLAFWGLVIAFSWLLFKTAVDKGESKLATPFMLAVVFIYAQSVTNPYLNNPIGLGMILISLVCLGVLARKTEIHSI